MARGLSRKMFDQLRSDLEKLLQATDGYVLRAEEASSTEEAKLWIRKAHEDQRQNRLEEARNFITQFEDDLLPYFANGEEVDPFAIDPVVSPVVTSHDNNLWRYASLTWSVPVSQGYGRRTKFLVRDRSNGKLIAIFALGDPVIGLQVRDSQIGWDKEQRHNRLYNVYDAFVLGSVDPYRQLLGGKLVALLAISNETRRYLTAKYTGTKTVITGQSKDPTPVLVTTSSALGRSSIYNRLTFGGHKAFTSVGYTRGFGHFHIPEEMFEQLVLLNRVQGKEEGAAFGKGANYRFRVIRAALNELGLSPEGLRHGIKREVFLAPLAHNWQEFLQGQTNVVDPIDMPADEISEYFRDRWAIPRAIRKPDYSTWRNTSMRLSEQIPNVHIQYSFASAFANAALVAPRSEDEWTVGPVKINRTSDVVKQVGKTVSGTESEGTSHLTTVSVGKIHVQVADTTWSNGERDVQAINRLDSPEIVDTLIRRLRIGIYPSPAQEQLVYMELRAALPDADGRAVLRKLSIEKLESILGTSISQLLPRSQGIIVGTRQQLFRDEGRRRTELCAMFPKDNLQIAHTVWVVTRLLTFLSGLENEEKKLNKNGLEAGRKRATKK